MTALSFSVFKYKLLCGEKRQTIRRIRKYPIKIGDTLQIYWKQRSKYCEKLFDAKCIGIQVIKINPLAKSVFLCHQPLIQPLIHRLAQKDGFEDSEAFFDFFAKSYGNSFEGVVIYFEKLQLGLSFLTLDQVQLVESLKVSRGEEGVKLRSQVADSIKNQLIADVGRLQELNDGKFTIACICILADRYNLPLKTMCDVLSLTGFKTTHVYDRFTSQYSVSQLQDLGKKLFEELEQKQ